MTRTYVLTIKAKETDENIVTMLSGISYLSDNLPLDAVQVFEPQQNTNTTKLSTNKKLFQRLENYIDAGISTEEAEVDNDCFFYDVADKDLMLKNILNTLTEYDKYYDQKRIV